jgi:hypothetical protein
MQLQVADLVSWDELERMQVPIFREAFTHLLDNDITHPFDTSGQLLLSLSQYPSVGKFVTMLGALDYTLSLYLSISVYGRPWLHALRGATDLRES